LASFLLISPEQTPITQSRFLKRLLGITFRQGYENCATVSILSADDKILQPTVIMAVFLFFGSAFFLYIKARQGPGPYLFPCVFACICLGMSPVSIRVITTTDDVACDVLDISLTTAALLPYPFYLASPPPSLKRVLALMVVFTSRLAGQSSFPSVSTPPSLSLAQSSSSPPQSLTNSRTASNSSSHP
jgi:hypothetical protein